MGFPLHPGETDLLSAATRYLPHEEEDPRPWLQALPSGATQLLTFIHEATHYWCFNSGVVDALLHVSVRLEINSEVLIALWEDPSSPPAEGSPEQGINLFGRFLRAIHGDKRLGSGAHLRPWRRELLAMIRDDLIRLQVAQAILRPLAEGLALFAEYDAVSRTGSQSWSPLPGAIAVNFGGISRLREEPYASLPEPLGTMYMAGQLVREARLTRAAVAAKASMLAQPLSSAAGGYLPGYLAVKNMWRSLYRKSFRLYGESDLVLVYLRSFFYEDMALAAAIVSQPGGEPGQAANEIIRAFTRRLADLDRVTPEDVEGYDVYLSSAESKERGAYRPGMLRSAAEQRALRDSVEAAFREYQQTGLSARLYPDIVRHRLGRLEEVRQLRDSLITCSVPVALSAPADGDGIDVSWRGTHVLHVPEADLVPAQPTRDEPVPALPEEARLDIVLPEFNRISGLSRAAVISAGKRLISSTFFGDPGQRDSVREAIRRKFASRDDRISGAQATGLLAGWIGETDLEVKIIRDSMAQSVPEAVDDTYRDTALWYARNTAAIDECARLMHDRGMYALLGSAELLKRVALLGLAASINSYEHFIAQSFDEHGYDLRDTLDRLGASWERHGFPRSVLTDESDKGTLLLPHI